MNAQTAAQTAAIVRAELRKALAPRRLWWVVLLALAPCLLFSLLLLQNHLRAVQRADWANAGGRHLSAADFQGVNFKGMPRAALVAKLGEPAQSFRFRRRVRESNDVIRFQPREELDYSDGVSLHQFVLENGVVASVQTERPPSAGNVEAVFATVFEFFFLRLAVFFGCLGIFMNLFRAEMLNKSLHYYFLAPVPRARVMFAKFAAGLVAAVAVFCASAAVQMALLARISVLGGGAGAAPHFWAYLGITALACLGYGAVFLACGLLFRNPIVPAIVLLLWEGMVPFLPAVPQKISVIYYLMQLCPFRVDSVPGASPILALFVAPLDPIAPGLAIAGLLAVAAAVLWLSSRLVRRLEIDYTAE